MTAPQSLEGWQILIVDDEPDNISVTEALLTYHGAEVWCASDGREGLIMLDHITPTIILMDLSMPEIDGWQMLERLRANPRTARIPVVALTAHAMYDDAQRVKAAGFDGYITKPFPLTTFITTLKACLVK